jgi:hypothetical protein
MENSNMGCFTQLSNITVKDMEVFSTPRHPSLSFRLRDRNGMLMFRYRPNNYTNLDTHGIE